MTTPAHLASNPFQDLSGVDISAFANPYDALIHASNDDPASHSLHRPFAQSLISTSERAPKTIRHTPNNKKCPAKRETPRPRFHRRNHRSDPFTTAKSIERTRLRRSKTLSRFLGSSNRTRQNSHLTDPTKIISRRAKYVSPTHFADSFPHTIQTLIN